MRQQRSFDLMVGGVLAVVTTACLQARPHALPQAETAIAPIPDETAVGVPQIVYVDAGGTGTGNCDPRGTTWTIAPTKIEKAEDDLAPETPVGQINVADALPPLKALERSTREHSPMFGAGTRQPSVCRANLLFDSNNDGAIDSSDNDVEPWDWLVINYNVDDDNFNGISDIDDAPVIGEDDLAELQLSALDCDLVLGAATWSLSWPLETVKVWPSPDKTGDPSDVPLVSGQEYPWPLPSSVWLEVRERIEPMLMKLSVFPFVGAYGIPDTVVVTAECPAITLATADSKCYVNIRTDSNNDIEINNCDEVVEKDSGGVTVYVNDDDDNNNGILDMYESPVVGENDLQEVQLSTNCVPKDPKKAWWSFTWAASEQDKSQVWREPDKSDGSGGTSVPLINGEHYPWPPPATVWMEALGRFSDQAIEFTVFDGNETIATE